MSTEILIESPIAKSVAEKRYILCPVLVPDVEDHQHDVVSREDIEKAIWDMSNDEGLLDREHWLVDTNQGKPVERYVMPVDGLFTKRPEVPEEVTKTIATIAKMQRDLVEKYPDDVRLVVQGTGMLGAILSPENWEAVKKGDITGMSIYGYGHRKPITV